MVTVTIDGKTIEVQAGTTVLNAARKAGIEIPTLCDHSALTPYGGCRLCLVEVEGARTLQPSCTLPVSDKMVVRTDTEKVKEARKFVLTLIFSERNHFCPYCQVSGGDCELQNAAYAEGMTHWPLQPNWQAYPVDASHPYIILENNRCILCRRCVRACGELVGNFTLGFEERGARSILVADLGIPMGASSCISCGACVQVCPTGALIDRWSAYQGKETQVEKTETVCNGCSVGCKLDVLTRDNRMVRIEGDWNDPVSGGAICKVGRFQPMDEKRSRIVTAMVRDNGALKAATVEKAVDAAVAKLKGGAGLVSSRLPAEALYHFKQTFGGTSLEEGAATALASSLADDMGKPFEGDLAAIEHSDCVVVIGTDLVVDHEVAGFFVKRALPNGTKLVVVDPAANGLDTYANATLKAAKGAEVDVMAGLMAGTVKAGKPQGATKLDAAAVLKDASERTGLAEEKFVEAGKLIANASCPVFIYGKNFASKATKPALKTIVEMAELTNGAVVGMKGEANSMAAAQYKLDTAFEPKDQAVIVVLGDETPSQALLKKLHKVPFLVVAATYESALTAKADVVLPTEAWNEMEGHFLSLEGRMQVAKKALVAPEGVLSADAIIKMFADKMGVKLDDKWEEALAQRTAIVEPVKA